MNTDASGGSLVLGIYTVMGLFTMYMLFNTIMVRKKLKKAIKVFDPRFKILQSILIAMLLYMSFFTKSLYLKIVVIFIALFFTYMSFERIRITEDGIYYNGRLDKWEDIDRWEFHPKGNLMLTILRGKSSRVIPFKVEDKSEADKIIKEYKSAKKKEKNKYKIQINKNLLFKNNRTPCGLD